jgi:hypothetical protein
MDLLNAPKNGRVPQAGDVIVTVGVRPLIAWYLILDAERIDRPGADAPRFLLRVRIVSEKYADGRRGAWLWKMKRYGR